ncbi:MAG: hypothetical protein IJR41_01240 [Atopobiaceae bacterium]|nr:hypothetical protein [Atopobiaceae bacterium]
MDVAAELIRYLDAETSIGWYHNTPPDSGGEHGTLTRDGGPVEIVRDLPTMTLMVHAGSRKRAQELAREASIALIESKWAIPNVFGAEILGSAYDPLDGRHRWRITASLIVND